MMLICLYNSVTIKKKCLHVIAILLSRKFIHLIILLLPVETQSKGLFGLGGLWVTRSTGFGLLRTVDVLI